MNKQDRPQYAAMHGFYCQPDGGQWNVPVTMEDSSTVGWALIKGRDLVGTFKDKEGFSYLIIGEGFHKTEQP